MPLRASLPDVEARKEAAHGPGVAPVRVSEARFEHRLLDERDVNRVDESEQRRPREMGRRSKHSGLANEDEDDPADHRIAYVAIRAVHDERPRRVPRREGSSSAGPEV